MQTLLLYASVVLIWGTTWVAIPFQLGDIDVEVSVGYRFLLAALLLYVYAVLTRRRLAVPLSALPTVLLQGLLLFCINYLFIYHGTAYLSSGLVAVLFSLIVILNAIFGRLFFKTSVDGRSLLAGAVGITGIGLLFWPEFRLPDSRGEALLGIALVLGGTLSASLGNMSAVANAARQLPVVAVNAHGMLLGGTLSLLLAVAQSRPLKFSFDTDYLVSLLYLAVFGSAVAFGCYIALLRRIGASRAAYSSVLFPVVALIMSTFVEGYRWSFTAALGILLTLIGNWLVLSQNSSKESP
ncbi:MAG: DMT family transporter [Pseudomonadota bacterium]